MLKPLMPHSRMRASDYYGANVRRRRLSAAVVAIVLTSSCISISIQGDPGLLCARSSKDDEDDEIIPGHHSVTERGDVDEAALTERLAKRADGLSSDFERGRLILPVSHALHIRVQHAIERAAPYLAQQEESPDESDFIKSLGRYPQSRRPFDASEIHLVVVSDDVPGAFTFPNGRLYVMTGLADPTLPYAAATEEELLGVLAHEIAHLRHRHVLEHWATLEADRKKIAKEALALITAASPISINIAKPSPNPEGLPLRLEYEADARAAEALKDMGIDPAAYLKILARLESFANANDGGAATWLEAGLEGRIACLTQCLNPTPARIRELEMYTEDDKLRFRDSPDGKIVELDAAHQYALCTAFQMDADAADQQRLDAWLRDPGNVVLNELPGLSASGYQTIAAFLVYKQGLFEWMSIIAASGAGARRQMMENCTEKIAGGRGVS